MRLLSIWSSRGRGSTSMMKVRSPVDLGPMDQLDALGLAVAGASTSLDSRSRSDFGIVVPGSRSLSRTTTFWPWNPRAEQLGLEADGVVDEDDVVDQELGQLEVAGRLGAPQADGVERHSLACRQLGRLGERLTLGRLPVGEQHDRRRRCAAELGEDLADAVARAGSGVPPASSAATLRRPARATLAGRSTSASSLAEFETR